VFCLLIIQNDLDELEFFSSEGDCCVGEPPGVYFIFPSDEEGEFVVGVVLVVASISWREIENFLT